MMNHKRKSFEGKPDQSSLSKKARNEADLLAKKDFLDRKVEWEIRKAKELKEAKVKEEQKAKELRELKKKQAASTPKKPSSSSSSSSGGQKGPGGEQPARSHGDGNDHVEDSSRSAIPEQNSGGHVAEIESEEDDEPEGGEQEEGGEDEEEEDTKKPGSEKGKRKRIRKDPNAKKGWKYTVSVAVPGSVVSIAQSSELRTHLAGQLARAFALFKVDEVVIYDDVEQKVNSTAGEFEGASKKGNPNVFLARILQYLETPQYLRKVLFPRHPDLQYAGLLNSLDCPHHARIGEELPFREGVIVDRPARQGRGSYANLGLLKDTQIDKLLEPNVRVTVRLQPDQKNPGKFTSYGRVVSASAPKEELGIYWGYRVRMAKSLSDVLTEGPYQGYDRTVGISEKGAPVEGVTFAPFKHLLIVFGGLHGLEACVDADEKLEVSGADAPSLFDHYLNPCPNPGSKTLRAEELTFVTFSALRPIWEQFGAK